MIVTQNKNKVTTFLSLVVFTFMFVFGSAKIYTNEIQIYNFRRANGWMFLDRMTFGKGKAEASVTYKLSSKEIKQNSEFMMQIALVDDEKWESEQLQRCAKSSQSEFPTGIGEILMIARLNAQNQYTEKAYVAFQLQQEKTYHFVLRDCEKSILKDHFSRDSRIQIELNILNDGNYHSSTEQSYGVFLPLLLFMTAGMIYYGNKSKKAMGSEQSQSWTSYLLNISLWISLLSIVFKYMGYLIYVYISGKDYAFFDFMYLLLHSSADSIVCTLIILLAYGWTVTFKTSNDFDLYIPLITMLGLIHVIMTMLNKITDGEHDKYHMYDSIPSYIMLFFKCISICLLIIGIVKSFLNLKKTADKMRSYFTQIAVLGFIYISVIPIAMYLITFISASYRKEIIFIGIQVVKNIINLYFLYMSHHKKSTYSSLASSSFMEKDGKYL